MEEDAKHTEDDARIEGERQTEVRPEGKRRRERGRGIDHGNAVFLLQIESVRKKD